MIQRTQNCCSVSSNKVALHGWRLTCALHEGGRCRVLSGRSGALHHLQRPWRNCSPSIGTAPLCRSSSLEGDAQPDLEFTKQLRWSVLKLQALEEYKELLQLPDDEIPVLRAALLVARHAYPDLDEAAVVQQLDDWAAEVEAALLDARYPMRVLKEINHVLYQRHGLKGNEQDYYNRDNSCLNKVLETRTGIPITLALVYMEVAARLGVPMVGVNLPAHLMIRPDVEGVEVMVDAFNGGEICYLNDAEERLTAITGFQIQLDPRFVGDDAPRMPSQTLLLRLLNNLRQIYLTTNQPEEALWIIRYMRATVPGETLPAQQLMRDEGLCLYALHRYGDAMQVLSRYLQAAPTAPDRDVVSGLVMRMQQKASDASSSGSRGVVSPPNTGASSSSSSSSRIEWLGGAEGTMAVGSSSRASGRSSPEDPGDSMSSRIDSGFEADADTSSFSEGGAMEGKPSSRNGEQEAGGRGGAGTEARLSSGDAAGGRVETGAEPGNSSSQLEPSLEERPLSGHQHGSDEFGSSEDERDVRVDRGND